MFDETKDAASEADDREHPSETESPEDQADIREKSEESDYVRVPKAEFAAWKDNAERLNQIERQLAERPEPSPAAPKAAAETDDDYWNGVRYWAADRYDANGQLVKGDPVARATLANREADEERAKREGKLIGAVSSLLELSDIEDRTERAEVKKLVMSGRDVRSAQSEVRTRRLEAENEKLRADLAKHQARKADPDVVRTHEREVLASELKSKTIMSESKWDQRQAQLKLQGPSGAKQAMKEQGMFDRGEIELEWGC